MFELNVSFKFGAAHRLEEYDGQCENLHGHNFKVDVTVRADKLDKQGLAIDFRVIKELSREVINRLDHTYLNENKLLKGLNPSSENLAVCIFEELKKPLYKHGVKLHKITVWESEDSSASYYDD